MVALSRSVTMLDASMAPSVPPDHSDRLLGTWLGTYQVLGGLTTGGQASTYLARAAGSSDLVVVKLIREDLLTQPEAYARLRREAAVGTTLRAGNVARLISAELDGQRPYLVFEYVAGLSLGTLTTQRLDEGRPVPPGVVARILSGLLAGLHAVHEARGPDGELLDAVHRDVSPGNVMLSLDGVTKLIDLGLVRASTGALQTVVGTLMGTAPYIAPELVKYGAAVADRTADIFVASLIGYELLRGQRTLPLGTTAGRRRPDPAGARVRRPRAHARRAGAGRGARLGAGAQPPVVHGAADGRGAAGRSRRRPGQRARGGGGVRHGAGARARVCAGPPRHHRRPRGGGAARPRVRRLRADAHGPEHRTHHAGVSAAAQRTAQPRAGAGHQRGARGVAAHAAHRAARLRAARCARGRCVALARPAEADAADRGRDGGAR
jgi:hypothetical protein